MWLSAALNTRGHTPYRLSAVLPLTREFRFLKNIVSFFRRSFRFFEYTTLNFGFGT